MYIKVRRYGQVVRQWVANSLPPVQIRVPPNLLVFKFRILVLGGCGGMVDTTDLKSVGFSVVRVRVPPPPDL